MQNNKPYILVCNDDGFQAPGIAALVKAVAGLGEVVVVAPDGPRSGMGAALTPNVPLRVKLIRQEENTTWYKCSGTPVDCIKLAHAQLLDRRPDMIVSGINHGSNAAINVIYSGTMGAALEGCTQGIPSVGFSLCSHAEHSDFTEAARIAAIISKSVLQQGLPNGVCLNVNIPAIERTHGIKVCRQSPARWTKDFEKTIDPYGRAAYWMTGNFVNLDPESEDTDEWALDHGYVSVVPCQLDHTAYGSLESSRQQFETLG